MDHSLFRPHNRQTISITFEGLPLKPFELPHEIETAIVKLGYYPEHVETIYPAPEEGGTTYLYDALREPPKYGENDRRVRAWRPEWLDYDPGAMMSTCKAIIKAYARAAAFQDEPDIDELHSALQDARDAIPGYFEEVQAATTLEQSRIAGDEVDWWGSREPLPYAVTEERRTHNFGDHHQVAKEFLVEALDHWQESGAGHLINLYFDAHDGYPTSDPLHDSVSGYPPSDTAEIEAIDADNEIAAARVVEDAERPRFAVGEHVRANAGHTFHGEVGEVVKPGIGLIHDPLLPMVQWSLGRQFEASRDLVKAAPHIGKYYAIDDVAARKWADEASVAFGCDATCDIYYGDTCIAHFIKIEDVPAVFLRFGDRMSASD
jgi:hypothetical protein